MSRTVGFKVQVLCDLESCLDVPRARAGLIGHFKQVEASPANKLPILRGEADLNLLPSLQHLRRRCQWPDRAGSFLT